MRDDFPRKVIEMLAKRVGMRCSLCGQTTSGKVTYTVEDVVPDSHVQMTGGKRKLPSALRWADIQLVYSSSDPEKGLTPKSVDEILRDQKNLDSSTMCALVLAMWDRKRVIHPK